ncbi:hypothetical protein V8B97DRAFT_1990609 [Scleroderma yunnanense]
MRNIATIEASRDVGYSTVTQSLTDEPWSKVKEKITGHIHYRLVLKEVGHPPRDFLCTRDLVNTVRDAIIGTTGFDHLEIQIDSAHSPLGGIGVGEGSSS